MTGRKDDPDLAPDAALAVEHTEEREADQWAALGGEKDDIDEFDATDLDDGSDLGYVAPEKEEDEDEDPKDTKDSDDDEDDSGDASKEAEDDEGDDAPSEPAEEADEADAEVDSEDEDEADQKQAPKGIPKRRFDEVNEEKKALRVENERLKAQIEAGKPPEDQEEPYNIRENEKEYMDLLLDGDTEAALSKREEIDAAKEAKWKTETTADTRGDIEAEAEQTELLSLSREAEGMFDVFDPDHEDYNQGMLNKVLTFMRGYEASGEMSRGDAFVAGLADVVDMYDLMPEDVADTDVADTEPKPTGKKKVDKKKAALKEEAHQPVGDQGAASVDAGAVAANIEDMTDEELDALPEKTLARMRGDFV